MHQFLFIDKNDKCRWFDSDLCSIKIFRRFPLSVGVGLIATASIMISFNTAEEIRRFWFILTCSIISGRRSNRCLVTAETKRLERNQDTGIHHESLVRNHALYWFLSLQDPIYSRR